MRRWDLLWGKVLLLAACAAGAAWWTTSGVAGGDEIPFAAVLAGALLAVFGVAALYEGAGYGSAWVISKLRRAAGPRGPGSTGGDAGGAPRGDAPESGGDGAGTPMDGGVAADPERGPVSRDAPSVEDAEEPPARFGVQGALVTFVAYVAGSAVVWIVLGIVIGVRASGEAGADFEALFLERAPGFVVWSALCGVGAATLAFRALSPTPMRALPGIVAWGSWSRVLAGIAVGAGLNLAYLQLVRVLPVQPTRMPDSMLWEMLTGDGAARWTVLATAVLVAPVAEELVFRGFILDGLARVLGEGPGVVGAAVLFTALHVPDTAHYWPATVMILVVGTVAGVARVRSGTIGPAVGVHFGHNAVVALLWAL